MTKRFVLPVLLLVVGIAASACTGSSGGTQTDQRVSRQILNTYDKNQPVPVFPYSEYRQTIIDVETAEVHGVATTTFFYNQGNPSPIASCPSIGFPIATTSQITNPQQVVKGPFHESQVIGQLEPNGVYTGDSLGTYVVCVAKDGTKYVHYWEGYVDTIGGPAHFDTATHQEVLDGTPTVATGRH